MIITLRFLGMGASRQIRGSQVHCLTGAGVAELVHRAVWFATIVSIRIDRPMRHTLRLQITQSKYHSYTLWLNVGLFYRRGARVSLNVIIILIRAHMTPFSIPHSMLVYF